MLPTGRRRTQDQNQIDHNLWPGKKSGRHTRDRKELAVGSSCVC